MDLRKKPFAIKPEMSVAKQTFLYTVNSILAAIFIVVMIVYILPITIMVLLYCCIEMYEPFFYKNAIPSKIGIERIISIESHGSFRGGCGFAAFQIDDKTLEQIQKQGLSFFDDAKIARARDIKILEWKKITKDHYPQLEGLDLGSVDKYNFCAPEFRKKWSKHLLNTLDQPGNYYGEIDHYAEIMVLSKYKLVTFGHSE